MDDGCWRLWILFGIFVFVYAAARLGFLYWKSRKDKVTEEDIKTMVDEGHEQGVLETREAKMIRNIFEMDEKEAGDVMTHRKHITALSGSMSLREAALFILEEGNNTRYPVYGEDLDDILGTIHMRDVLAHAKNPNETDLELTRVPGVLREARFIPATRKLDSLFREMQSTKIQMEFVIDEYGQTEGLVTMEDILEAIVGNILDEYDVEERFIVHQENGELVMSGMTPLSQVQEVLEIGFPEEDLNNFDTINGLLISKLDRVLQEGERPKVVCQGVEFSVMKVDHKMIQTVGARKLVKEPEENKEETSEEEPKKEPHPIIPESHFGSHTKNREYRFVNVMEQLLMRQDLEAVLKQHSVCTCPRCMSDVCALALTGLPSKYVVTSKDSISPLLSYYENKYKIPVLTELMLACNKVRENPRHKK